MFLSASERAAADRRHASRARQRADRQAGRRAVRQAETLMKSAKGLSSSCMTVRCDEVSGYNEESKKNEGELREVRDMQDNLQKSKPHHLSLITLTQAESTSPPPSHLHPNPSSTTACPAAPPSHPIPPSHPSPCLRRPDEPPPVPPPQPRPRQYPRPSLRRQLQADWPTAA